MQNLQGCLSFITTQAALFPQASDPSRSQVSSFWDLFRGYRNLRDFLVSLPLGKHSPKLRHYRDAMDYRDLIWGWGNLMAFQFTYHQVGSISPRLRSHCDARYQFFGTSFEDGESQGFLVDFTVWAAFPYAQPHRDARSHISGSHLGMENLSVFWFYLPLGSVSPRLRSHGDVVYFRSHLFGTSSGDEFQCFLVYLTYQVAFPQAQVPLRCHVFQVSSFLGPHLGLGMGNQIRFSFFFFLFFLNFGKCPTWRSSIKKIQQNILIIILHFAYLLKSTIVEIW